MIFKGCGDLNPAAAVVRIHASNKATPPPKLKGSRQPERKGVRNVSNDHNLSRTAAIDVLFSFNFAVVFDFIYFRFRPSKAK
jgi:hypothetical protein